MRAAAVLVLALLFPAVAAAAAPPATTGPATNVTQTTATIAGTVDAQGIDTTYYFEYGTSSAYGLKTDPAHTSGGATDVHADLSGLTTDTAYHYRVVATNANGTALGNDRIFTTLAVTPARAVPSATSRVKPRWDHVRPFRFRVRGGLILPAGVNPADACRGRVTIRFKLRRKTIRLRRTHVSANCRYRSRVRVPLRPRRRSVKLRVLVRFRGNAVLRSKSAPTQRVRAG